MWLQRDRFVVNITITSIAQHTSWCYNSCKLCSRTSRPFDFTYRYTHCSYIGIAVPRYKVVLTAADSTGEATFILFGKTAQRIIRKPAETLIEQNPPDREYIQMKLQLLSTRPLFGMLASQRIPS